MEDFGYEKNDDGGKIPLALKKFFLFGATVFSIACFIYITISAYYFVYEDQGGEIETIKSPAGPIKISDEEIALEEDGGIKVDRSIYEDIFGNKKSAKQQAAPKVRSAAEPAIPPKKEIKKEDGQPQKIGIFSNENKTKESSKDLLTKESGEEKSAPTEMQKKKRAVRVQIAAMSSRNAAKEQWERLNRMHGNLFSRLRSFTQEVDLGKRGVFYRLQIGEFYNQVEAEEFCNRYIAQLGKSKADCIVVE